MMRAGVNQWWPSGHPGAVVRAIRTAVALNLLAPMPMSGLFAGERVPGASAAQPAPAQAAGFAEVTVQSGIRHHHHKPVLDHKLDNIMSWVCSVGAAAAAGDFDNDGWVDLYATDSRKGEPNYLYRNNGDGTFTDVAERAGVARLNSDAGVSMDCVWGDYDNDGWIDLYVVRWGTDVLLRNNRDGTFTDVTDRCFSKRDGSAGTEWANGNAAIFLDFNLDGRLDIYVGNYFREHDLWHLDTTRIMHDDFERARNGGANFLYRQEPDGRFVETAAALGVDDPGWTLAVGSADVNNDGWPDLYCADDFGPDQLFLNGGDGTFVNATEKAIGLDTKKGMNVDFGDFNNDGWLDIYVTNITTAEYLQEGNMLWHNNGLGPDGMLTFTDVALETGVYDGGWGWGAKFLDFDNDGDLDIMAVNGFISAGEGDYWYDLASWTVTGQEASDARNWPSIGDRSFSGYEPARFFRNDGLYSFSECAAQLGLNSVRDGRGVVAFDYDNDGDLDLFVANQGEQPHLFRNDLSATANWLMVRLKGETTAGVNRDAVGARVSIVTSRGTQIREGDGGKCYSGQSDPRLHFGLASESQVQLLEVRWPDGGLQYLENVPANRLIAVRQDPARYASRVAMTAANPQPWNRAESKKPERGASVNAADLERMLAEMEGGLRWPLKAHAPASRYRAFCAAHGQHDRAIKFFEKAVARYPDDPMGRIQLACAYVDKIPTCGGIAAIVSKGTLARKALDHLDSVIADDSESWVAYYCRAMNHLHWPRALRHSDDAAADFGRCIALQSRAGKADAEPYFVRPYAGLGDARTKAKRYEEARRAWREGLKLFPASAMLQARLEVKTDDELLDYVESQRSLESNIDTDLSFLDGSSRGSGAVVSGAK